MWPLCTANNFLWILLPLLIGFLTGWWAWANRRKEADYAYAAPVAEPVAPVAPRVVAPEPVAAPVAPPQAFVEPTPAPAPSAAPLATGASAGGVAAVAAAAMTAIGIPAAVGKADDLLQLKGVGPKLNTLLNSLGVTRFDQIAAWGASEVSKVDGHLGSFKGRIDRDNWVEQAGLLARGAIAEFEAKYGKLDSENQ
jgi:predicted flap endonuclease-1-like 5' DNA nuclease